MNTISLVNLIISLILWAVLAVAYTYFLNRKKRLIKNRVTLIAAVTFGVTILLHVVITSYIYTTTTFVLLLFFSLPFLVCVVVSSRFMFGKTENKWRIRRIISSLLKDALRLHPEKPEMLAPECVCFTSTQKIVDGTKNAMHN